MDHVERIAMIVTTLLIVVCFWSVHYELRDQTVHLQEMSRLLEGFGLCESRIAVEEPDIDVTLGWTGRDGSKILCSNFPEEWCRGHELLFEYYAGPGYRKEFLDTMQRMTPL